MLHRILFQGVDRKRIIVVFLILLQSIFVVARRQNNHDSHDSDRVIYDNSSEYENDVMNNIRGRKMISIISTSSLEMCTDSGMGAGVENCSKKLLIAATISNGESDGTGALLFDLSQAESIQDPTDEYQGYSSPDTLSISIFQSSINLLYPMTYLQDFNEEAYEIVHTTDAGGARYGLMNPCKDGATDEETGCGWVKKNGVNVPYSQGFCCRCSVTGSLTSYLMPRSGETCRFAEQHDSAHCLRMNALWHSAYEIGAPIIDFQIRIRVTQCRPKASSPLNATELLSLKCTGPSDHCDCISETHTGLESTANNPIRIAFGPKRPSFCLPLPFTTSSSPSLARKCDIEVQLQGSFVAYEGTPSFASKYLLVPSVCSFPTPPTPAETLACAAALSRPTDEWMLVEKSAATVTGSECNKVGVGYEAFQSQGNACNSLKGSCLSAQPRHIYEADKLRVANGNTPQLFLGGVREPSAPAGPGGNPAPYNFSVAEILADRRAAGRQFTLPTQRFQRSMFTMAVRADPDSLRFITFTPPMVIIRARPILYVAGGQQGSSRRLDVSATPVAAPFTFQIEIFNAGSVGGRVTVSMDCGETLLTPPARELSLAPGPAVPQVSESNHGGLIDSQPVSLGAGRGGNSSVSRADALQRAAAASFVSRPAGSSLTVDFYVTSALSSRQEEAVICGVVAVGPTGTVLDAAMVTFMLAAEEEDRGGQGGNDDVNDDDRGSGGNSSDVDGVSLCGEKCPSVFDVICAAKAAKTCTGRLAGSLAVGVGALGTLALLIKFPFLWLTPLRMLFSCCCCCSRESRKNDDKEEEESEKGREKRTIRKVNPLTAAGRIRQDDNYINEESEFQQLSARRRKISSEGLVGDANRSRRQFSDVDPNVYNNEYLFLPGMVTKGGFNGGSSRDMTLSRRNPIFAHMDADHIPSYSHSHHSSAISSGGALSRSYSHSPTHSHVSRNGKKGDLLAGTFVGVPAGNAFGVAYGESDRDLHGRRVRSQERPLDRQRNDFHSLQMRSTMPIRTGGLGIAEGSFSRRQVGTANYSQSLSRLDPLGVASGIPLHAQRSLRQSHSQLSGLSGDTHADREEELQSSNSYRDFGEALEDTDLALGVSMVRSRANAYNARESEPDSYYSQTPRSEGCNSDHNYTQVARTGGVNNLLDGIDDDLRIPETRRTLELEYAEKGEFTRRSDTNSVECSAENTSPLALRIDICNNNNNNNNNSITARSLRQRNSARQLSALTGPSVSNNYSKTQGNIALGSNNAVGSSGIPSANGTWANTTPYQSMRSEMGTGTGAMPNMNETTTKYTKRFKGKNYVSNTGIGPSK